MQNQRAITSLTESSSESMQNQRAITSLTESMHNRRAIASLTEQLREYAEPESHHQPHREQLREHAEPESHHQPHREQLREHAGRKINQVSRIQVKHLPSRTPIPLVSASSPADLRTSPGDLS
ncbi:UNVERIFIED_CONTAM: hypothetical protein FKN15_030200 [Acipenser sinensis]